MNDSLNTVKDFSPFRIQYTPLSHSIQCFIEQLHVVVKQVLGRAAKLEIEEAKVQWTCLNRSCYREQNKQRTGCCKVVLCDGTVPVTFKVCSVVCHVEKLCHRVHSTFDKTPCSCRKEVQV
uniref:AAI domain-containing protein n=1 Tax=Steinernema glaseri TaxID=37863 RepID=A0A1I7ZT57_9BILA